jgi:aminopeptidase N
MLAVYSDEGWTLDPSTGFGDTLTGDTADYSVRVTTSVGPTPVASGELIDMSSEGDSATYVFTARNARDFALVLVEGHIPSTTALDDATIRTWFSAPHQRAALLANEMAVFSFQLYEELVGPCPFRKIEFVEVPLRSAAGVEFSGLILIGAQYAEQPDDLFFSVIISHETAHQWFYAGVGNDVSEHPWLDESFATYLSYEFLAAYINPATAQMEIERWRNTYQIAERARRDLSVASPKYAFPDSSTYSSFVYSGGAVFLYDLRQELGREAFYRGLQAYYRTMLHDIATPTDLILIIEGSCSCQIDALLATYRIMP